ncbi:amino acid ABC transporter permease [Nocardioides sp. BP30]|uniref:amino acid ABC transporter permease n=1 Tax=Nocardioides sp. BP30 TaxID=3036374 RepID=UPI0024698F6E|nr:amino acid ABC transporter permease [Nocardioides sp. BP30]WGL52694.1 amino acid ABC transporter permease [Nocardioides sp. BP30]
MSTEAVADADRGWTPSPHQLQRARIAASMRRRRAVLATVVTIVVLGAVLAVFLTSPGWPAFRDYFLSWSDFKGAFPSVSRGFWFNIRVFLVAEPCVLVFASLVAVCRQSRSPWLAPLRLVSVVYTDLFRGIPSIVVVVIIGVGTPALQLNGVPTSLFWLGTISLILCYGAYVAEVLRAGILAVHPTQWSSAEALGLSRTQAMWRVIFPQAVRRSVPPLMNDLVSLQKDTALLSTLGVWEALRAASDWQGYHFNGTSLLVTALYFLVIAVPLTRLTDWLMLRQIRREQGR